MRVYTCVEMSTGWRIQLERGTGRIHPQQRPASAGFIQEGSCIVPGRVAAVRDIRRVL